MAGTVSVACKIPNGLILRVFKQEEYFEPVYGGGTRKTFRSVLSADPVHLKGPAAPFGMLPKAPVEGGYALNHGIDADFWKAWLDQNKDSDIVKNNLVFAQAKPESVSSQAREHVAEKSGLEPLNPETTIRNGKQVQVDPRFPKSSNPNLSEVSTYDGKAA